MMLLLEEDNRNKLTWMRMETQLLMCISSCTHEQLSWVFPLKCLMIVVVC
jgi:hypothetical protein